MKRYKHLTEAVRDTGKDEVDFRKVKKGASLTDLASDYIKEVQERQEQKRCVLNQIESTVIKVLINIPNLAINEAFINNTILILNGHHKGNVNKLDELAGFIAKKVIKCN